MASIESARSGTARAVRAITLGAACALALYLLLQRGIFHGQAQSFDTLLYARSLWGVAHGDFWNPVSAEPVFAIHAQLVLWLLAPWVHWFRAADVLVFAQAAAYGCSVALLTSAFVREWAGLPKAEECLCALAAALLFGFCSPLLSNPLLFDARPEVLGVPCLVWALLHAVRVERADRLVLVGIAAASLAREEFALAGGLGLWLMPIAHDRGRRAAWGLGFVAYFALVYGLSHRGLASEQLHFAESSLRADQLVAHKSAWLFIALATGGGLALRGYRWLGAALPGAAFVLFSRWLPESQLSLHYGMFAVPGLCAAAFAGYRRVLTQPSPRWQMAGHIAISVGCYVFASAWPGGALFARDYFDVQGPPLAAASYHQHTHWLQDVHETLARIPAQHALVVPYMFGAPVADRAIIKSLERETAQSLVEPDVDTAAILRKDWYRLGRPLRQHGFQLTALAGTNMAVLSRNAQSLDLQQLPIAARCDAVAAHWHDAGIGLCNIWLGDDARVHAVFVRTAALQGEHAPETRRAWQAQVATEHSTSEYTLWPLDGLLALQELPLGMPLLASTHEPVAETDVRLSLRDDAGKVVPIVVGGHGDSTSDAVHLRLLRD